MNKDLLKQHISVFIADSKENPQQFQDEYRERLELVEYYQSFTKEKISSLSEEDVYDYISRLWAMLIWGNKHYVVDKILSNNGLEHFRKCLGEL